MEDTLRLMGTSFLLPALILWLFLGGGAARATTTGKIVLVLIAWGLALAAIMAARSFYHDAYEEMTGNLLAVILGLFLTLRAHRKPA